MEVAQSDMVGVIIPGGLSVLASVRIWRMNQSQKSELNADKTAISIAQRRNYSETEAAQHLLTAIETVARIERLSGLDFGELIRYQNLIAIAIAGFSPVGIPGNKIGDR